MFERRSYLNAGTTGPVPRSAADAVRERVERDTREGRCGRGYFEGLMAMVADLRAAYARALGCEPSEVALTGSTTDGVNTVISGLDWRYGDEVITTSEEHPGLLAPLGRARARHGIEIKVVPFAELPSHVSRKTRLIACSHVSWVSGRVMDTNALVQTGVPVLLDAAQALGAVPVDVHALGCDFYAASGQKWLCGPEGSGCLYVKRERLDELLVPWPGFGSLADPHRPLEFVPAETTARFDLGFPVGVRSAWALASLQVFEQAGWPWVHERAASLAAGLAESLTAAGKDVWPRGRSTLVSWAVGADAQAEVERLAADGIVVRSIPSSGLIRASVGAWTSEDELDLLLSAVAPRAARST